MTRPLVSGSAECQIYNLEVSHMTKRKKALKPVMHWVTIATIIVALAIAATAQGSDRSAELAGGHARPAPEGAREVALVSEPEHERDLGLRIVI